MTAVSLSRGGRAIALAGVVLPLALIGFSKFAAFEVEALQPLVGGTPWLAWMYSAFGVVGATRVLGVVEMATALMLIASPWAPRAGVAGGALAALTFLVTCSTMFAFPVWERNAVGPMPALAGPGQFLIKDVALLGISIVVFGESLAQVRQRRRHA
jgi:uncharacterized membrane protein YkgB